MDRQTQELLDFDKILNELADYALSPEGRDLLGRQEFLYDPAGLEDLLNRAGEFRMLLELTEGFPGADFPELDFLGRIEKEGTVLEGPEAAALGRYIRSAEILRKYLSRRPENRPEYTGLLAEEAAGLPDLKDLEKEIFRNLDDQGSILENHPALRPIRKSLDRAARELRELSYKYLQGSQDIWQTEVPTIRDGRMVLPLKANHRGKVQGIIHEYSAKGATVFIEPFDVVEKNNQMALLENRLRNEELKILRELTGFIRGRLEDCAVLRTQVGRIDSLYVRARYSWLHNCCRPEILERGLRLKEARHPSLGAKAVPISFSMAGGTATLIITGPNTGGKTVSLKTAGLLIMMHQFGMDIPAAGGSGLALFTGVYADIGDDQSIEASLSTFSGHMTRYAFIMEACREVRSGRSEDTPPGAESRDGSGARGTGPGPAPPAPLVLLDELGGGTDPQEGAALAMAVLDWFSARGVPVICTTHLGVMKNYGYTRPGAANASVTFDEDSLRPTYHIIEGIPGESHALEIAASSGLDGGVIQTAREYREQDKSSVSGMIRELQESQRKNYLWEKDLERKEKELTEAVREKDLRELRLRRKEAELKSEDYRELRRYVRESRKELENLVARLVAAGERNQPGGEQPGLSGGALDREETRRVKDFVNALGDKLAWEDEREEERLALLRSPGSSEHPGGSVPPEEAPPGAFEPGSPVRVISTGKIGTLVRKDRKGKWQVALGTLKMTIEEGDLFPLGETKAAKASYQLSREPGGSSGRYVSMELDLRGMRLEEALRALELQIDSCLLSGVSAFGVIHGLGEGILQKGVRDYLASSPAVKSFQFAHPDQGGFGKTEVQL